MWHILSNRPLSTRAIRSVVTALLLAGALALGQPHVYADAVDELRQALRLEEARIPTGEALGNRQETLQAKIDQLRTISDLRRALSLEEWKDIESLVVNKKIREMDSDMRSQVGTRLTKAIQDVVQNGDANSRLAIGLLIAEPGPTVRSLDPQDRGGYARSLTKELIQLTQDKDLGVREQALRALGNVFPKPKDAVSIFKMALEKEAPGPKRLAADGLGQLIRVVNHLEKLGGSATGVVALPPDVLDTVVAVLGANSAGLQDKDPQVRALCLQNIQAAADCLANLNRDAKKDFPPEGRKLTPQEQKFILDQHDRINRELKELVPALDALREQGNALARGLEDPAITVRLAALDALESIGNFRLRLKKRVLSVPLVPKEAGGDLGNRDLLKSYDTLEAFISKNLGSITRLLGESNVELRRKAVEFLDIIEEAAAPALPLLANSLSDPDRFVRWSAARAIANIAPAKAAVTVPALARLLSDPDLSVRQEAAKTLKEIGPAAYLAVPALAQAVISGDVEGRLAAMEALQSIGPEKGKEAVPSLVQLLGHDGHPDARVRRLAAKTLGGFGPDAFAAVPVLRLAIGDEDQEVRMNAGDAILSILQRREKY